VERRSHSRTRPVISAQPAHRCGFPPHHIQDFANPRASACGARKADCFEAPAGQMYIGSYHRAARRAADAISTSGDRVVILSYAGADVSG
jgi:hypothetical protein